MQKVWVVTRILDGETYTYVFASVGAARGFVGRKLPGRYHCEEFDVYISGEEPFTEQKFE